MARFPELQGKVALITGAGRRAGLGEGIARRLLQEGCKVVLTDIGQVRGAEMPVTAVGTDEELAQVAAELAASSGGECVAMALDVLDEAQVQAVIAATVARFGALDILVNNAGIALGGGPVDQIGFDDYQRMLAVNVTGVFVATQEAVRHMGQGGRIVHIGSSMTRSPLPRAARSPLA